MMGAGLIPTMIAFAIGTVSLMPVGMCFEELTAAISISSGIIEYVEHTFGRNIGLGFVTEWMLLLDNTPLCPPWEMIAVGNAHLMKDLRTASRRLEEKLPCVRLQLQLAYGSCL